MHRDQVGYGKIPEINLIPMLNVMMGVLAFFVIIAATLSAEKGVDIALTGGKNQPSPPANEVLPDPLLVEIKPPDQILVNTKSANREQVLATIKSYLQANPKGVVLLKADRKMQYDRVVSLLGDMQSAGGERVSLALEEDEAGVSSPASAASTGESTALPEARAGAETSSDTAPSSQTGEASTPTPGVVIPDVPDDYDS